MQIYPEGLIALALHNSKLTDKQLRTLLNASPSMETILSFDKAKIEQLELHTDVSVTLKSVDQALQSIHQENSEIARQWHYCVTEQIGVLSLNNKDYPLLLKNTYDPPPFLYYRGDKQLLNQPQLAMVGSRRSTQQGANNARLFAKALAKAGFTITSGLALGIDAFSHQGALEGEGKTIAVLGTGIDVIYPWRNKHLYHQIINKGLVVSELPLGSKAKKGHFPRRNRIISGLSLGVLVVEATLQSGSLITARLALEQGREVFAMPSSIHNLSGKGCHEIIRQGAKLVETIDHVMEELSGWVPKLPLNTIPQQQPQALALNAQQQQLLASLDFEPQPVELLQQHSKMATSELMATLVQLELKGLVENNAGYYQRVVTEASATGSSR